MTCTAVSVLPVPGGPTTMVRPGCTPARIASTWPPSAVSPLLQMQACHICLQRKCSRLPKAHCLVCSQPRARRSEPLHPQRISERAGGAPAQA